MDKKRILFICSRNSARSQMAEGLVNALYGDRVQAFSGGTAAGGVHPAAIKAMAEIGIDISGHKSKSATEFVGESFDFIVTLCENAKRGCPFFPGGNETIHIAFKDPAACKGTEYDILSCFRRSRDEILAWIKETLIKRIT